MESQNWLGGEDVGRSFIHQLFIEAPVCSPLCWALSRQRTLTLTWESDADNYTRQLTSGVALRTEPVGGMHSLIWGYRVELKKKSLLS